jgi:DNA invertase Pin-like site-specific DNA recombinase
VSSRGQRHDSQRDALTQWLKAHGTDPAKVGWYVDTESGRKMARPELDRLNADVFSGAVRTVVVFKIDRIARRLRDGLNLLCDWADRGVRFVSVGQQIDLSGTVGRMVAALMLGLAEIEWEHRRDRQAAGIAAAKRRGVYEGKGRPKGATKRGKAKRYPERARALRAKGNSVPEIARALDVSPRTVFRYLGAAAGGER